MGGSRRRTWKVMATALVAVVFVALVVVRGVILDDSATSVDADTAVDNFRSSTVPTETTATPAVTEVEATTPDPVPATPAPGVYRYSTEGTETVDALGGASHSYPAETFVAVTARQNGAHDCVHLRWDLLEERRDEWDLCADSDGIWLQADTVDWHAFFGQGEEVTTDCMSPALVVPAGVTELDEMTSSFEPTPMSCIRRDGQWDHQWQVLGTEVLEVGSGSVRVVHARLSVALATETTVVDWWMTADGLPVRMTSTKESSSETVVGTIAYTETYIAELVSLTPMR